jgi:ribosome biogenesis GTPase
VAPIVVLTKADIAAADPALRDERPRRARERMLRRACRRSSSTRPIRRARPLRARRLRRADAGAARLVGCRQVDPDQHPDRQRGPGQPARCARTTAAACTRRRARSLHLLPGGACVIDTPGLRTLRPDIDEATLAASFGDVETLALQCRFRDCTHGGEPGCAVPAGVDPTGCATSRSCCARPGAIR